MDFIEDVVGPVVFIMVVGIIFCFVFYSFDKKRTEEIDALVNKNELEVYDNCWKLENKYYCK